MFRKLPIWLRVASIPFLTFIVGGLLSTIFQDFVQSQVLPSELWVLAIIAVSLALITVLAATIFTDLRQLGIQLGIKTSYYELGHEADDQASLFDAATEIVRKARISLYVVEADLVENWGDDQSRKETPKSNRARDNYYDALLDRAIHGRVVYERIFQMLDGQTIVQRVIGESKLHHYTEMLEERDVRHNPRVGLLRAPAQRLLTFVLVDDIYLLLQINEMLEDGSRRMNGILCIEDRRGDITRYFREFYDSLKRSSRIASVQLSDLPPLIHASSSS